MADHSMMKLGKKPAVYSDKTLAFADYTAKLEKAPETCDLTAKMSDLGIMLNDSLGDCTAACCGHIIQQWTAENGNQVILPDSTILNLYEATGGYVLGDPSTDNGAVILDVLSYWKKNGISNHQLGAFVYLNPKYGHQLKNAVYYFGSSNVGVQLPISAQTQDIWDVDHSPRGEVESWGGHCIPIVAYDQHHLTCITWGEFKKMTWAFFEKYCDEVYCLLSPDWLGDAELCPEGFDAAALREDLAKIAHS